MQIYTCNFVKKENLGVLTILGKYYTLDKHFKQGFKLFGPIFNNLLYAMDNIVLLHKCYIYNIKIFKKMQKVDNSEICKF